MNTRMLLVYVTAASLQEAERISRTVVEEGLAACANIVGKIRSIYRWEGRVEKGTEYAFWLKTRPALWSALEARVRSLHSYEVPCIVALPIERGHEPFLGWVQSETREPSPHRQQAKGRKQR